MRRREITAVCIFLIGFAVLPPLLSADTLQALLEREWQYELRQDPQLATAVGDRRYNVIWNDYSISGMKEQQRDLSEWLRLFEQLDPKTLDAEGRMLRRSQLKENRALVPQSAEQLLGLYRDYVSRIQAALPRMFHVGTLPTLEVRPVPKYSEGAAACAKYLQAPPDGSRPAILLINTGHSESRTLVGVESTAYHEGVPGHHLQISIALRLAIPEFRREGSFTAFTEGWALYAEGLGQELGFYRAPYSEYGRLSNEMLRAIRLVVDTGVHYRHWTRQPVVDYFHENSSEDEPTVQSETDRYIAQPAQALAYKIGEQTILELRRQARSALGSRFRIEDFHERVLEEGSIPLDVLRARVKEWIAHRGAISQ